MRDQFGAVSVADLERETDLGALWARLAVRWWLVACGLVLGVALGVLLWATGGKSYQATALLYLGQPFTPGNGGASQIQSLATDPNTVSKIVHSKAALTLASEASGLTLGQLRGQVTTVVVADPNQAKSTSPLDEIVVHGESRLKVQKAADALARTASSRLSVYVEKKITLLQNESVFFQTSLDGVNARIEAALRLQRQALQSRGLQLAERFLIQSNANTSLNFFETRQEHLRHDLGGTKELLSLAEQVERSSVVEPAVAVEEGVRSLRNSILVGALIGLILGGLASYFAEPLLARRNPRAST
jgi:hypothetical protein